jgi:hypothetical protein
VDSVPGRTAIGLPGSGCGVSRRAPPELRQLSSAQLFGQACRGLLSRFGHPGLDHFFGSWSQRLVLPGRFRDRN